MINTLFQRFDSEKSGDREVQRTMLELLNQLDGFSSSDGIKVQCGVAWWDGYNIVKVENNAKKEYLSAKYTQIALY